MAVSIVVAGCSPHPGPNWNLPTPSPAGNYATATDNNGYIRTNSGVAAAIGEGARLADVLVDPYRVDQVFTHARAVPTYITTGPSSTGNLIGDISDSLPLRSIRAGAAVGRETTTQPSGTAPYLYTALWEFDTADHARSAADAITTGLRAGRDNPTATPPLTGRRTTTQVDGQTVIDTAGQYPTATSLRVADRVISIAEAGGNVPRTRLQQVASTAITMQMRALATFSTPAILTAPQQDPMQSLVVYPVGDGSASNIYGSTYTAEGGLHWEGDAAAAAAAFQRAGVTRVAVGLSTVYQAHSPAQAQDLAAALLPTEQQVTLDSARLPAGAHCRRSTNDTDDVRPIYACTIAAGSRVGSASSNHRQDIEQMMTAQADLLRD